MLPCPPLENCPHVLSAIEGELAYQNRMCHDGTRCDDRDHGVAGQLVTLVSYASQAMHEWVMNKGNEKALHCIRKCAAICIRTLILYGCPARDGSKAIPAKGA